MTKNKKLKRLKRRKGLVKNRNVIKQHRQYTGSIKRKLERIQQAEKEGLLTKGL
tara:strand:+ start:1041 stop:1202 length:162 start_codon:yes stop_codon:yes gene_type:complete